MPAQAERETRRFTADEVLRMVETGILREDEPLELLDGELVVVSPRGPPHSSVASALDDLVRGAYVGGEFDERALRLDAHSPRG